MAAHYGAHEIMEMHEVLTCAIDFINKSQLLRPQVQDQQLAQMMDHQMQFAINEYNNMVQMLQNQGMGQAVPYRSPKAATPKYGLKQPEPQSPNMSAQDLDDRDISSILLGAHKASASKKMLAALECADPNLRRALQQGAINCSEQAYEVWQYMNEQGYYQVPTMKEMTTNTVINSYNQASESMQHMNTMQNMGQTMANNMGVMGRMNYETGNDYSSRMNPSNRPSYMTQTGYGRDMQHTGNTNMMNNTGENLNH
jgi:spore coat protein CotF